MRPIHLFELVSQHNSWLSARQAVIAGNVANVNTPGYRALDLVPFESVMEATRLRMAVTERGHMAPDRTAAAASTETENSESWDVYHSGSNVSIEQQLLNASSVSRSYTLNTNLLQSFHRMIRASARAGA